MTTSSQMLMIHSFSICMELVSESFVRGMHPSHIRHCSCHELEISQILVITGILGLMWDVNVWKLYSTGHPS